MSTYPDRLALRPLSEVQPRQVRWLVPGLIPLKTITLVAGVGGLGKSTLLAGIAAQVSQGEVGGEPADVILVSFEDTAAEVLRPRVEAAGGDLERVHQVVVDRLEIDPVCLPRDLGDLEILVHDTNARLLVIDPVVAAIDTAFDSHKDQHVRAILARLAGLAEESDAAVAMVGHLNKTPSREAYLRIGGSTAFYNAARSVILVTEDKTESDMRLIAQDKANYSRRKPVERHRIEEVILPGTLDPETGEPVITSRMVFVEIASDVDEADLLAPRESSGATREVEATRFLVGELATGEWIESAPIKDRAEEAGIAERTLQRAMRDLKVDVERSGFPAVKGRPAASACPGRPGSGSAKTRYPALVSGRERRLPEPARLAPRPLGPGDRGSGAKAPDAVLAPSHLRGVLDRCRCAAVLACAADGDVRRDDRQDVRASGPRRGRARARAT
jgi:hypothetical protein